MTPEQQARQNIDAPLAASDWVVQDYQQFNPIAARGIALQEASLQSGTCDYLLLVGRNAVGVPSLIEQTQILMEVEVERRLSVVEELEVVASTRLMRAGSLGQPILQKAFTGEV